MAGESVANIATSVGSPANERQFRPTSLGERRHATTNGAKQPSVGAWCFFFSTEVSLWCFLQLCLQCLSLPPRSYRPKWVLLFSLYMAISDLRIQNTRPRPTQTNFSAVLCRTRTVPLPRLPVPTGARLAASAPPPGRRCILRYYGSVELDETLSLARRPSASNMASPATGSKPGSFRTKER